MTRALFSARSFFRDPVGYVERNADGAAALGLRAGPSRFVVVRDPELVWHVLVRDGDAYVPGKWKRRIRRFVGPTLNTLSGDEHRRRRLLLQPALDRRRIAARVEGVEAEWRDGARFRLRDALDPLSLGAVGEVLLSAELEPGLARDLSRLVAAGPRLRPPLRGTETARVRARVVREVQTLVDERRAGRGTAAVDDLLAALLRAELPNEIVCGEVIAFLHAAVDEPSRTLESVWYLLSRHPAADERLSEELRRRESRFLDAVVRESLRLFPPARHIDRCPVRTVDLAGTRVGRRANVVVSPLVVHRDERVYERAGEFVPERWLDPAAGPRGAFVPFGAGAHTCIGEPLALAIVTQTLRRIVPRWRLRVDPDAPPPTPRTGDLWVTAERR